MTKLHVRLVAVMALLVIVLSACGGAAGTTGNTTTQSVPETGATTAPGGETGGDTTGVTGANCVGVDTQQLMTAGQQVYDQSCAGCHGAEGTGQGDFPGLTASEGVTTEDVTTLVTEYFSVEAHPRTLPAEDLAGVLTYVRGSFGNTANAICPDQIMVPAP